MVEIIDGEARVYSKEFNHADTDMSHYFVWREDTSRLYDLDHGPYPYKRILAKELQPKVDFIAQLLQEYKQSYSAYHSSPAYRSKQAIIDTFKQPQGLPPKKKRHR